MHRCQNSTDLCSNPGLLMGIKGSTEGESDSTGLILQAQKARLIKMCLAPMTLSTKSGHVQACRLVHGLYMANLTKCFDMLNYVN